MAKAKVIDKVISESRDVVRDPVGKLLDSDEFKALNAEQQRMLITTVLNMVIEGKLQ